MTLSIINPKDMRPIQIHILKTFTCKWKSQNKEIIACNRLLRFTYNGDKSFEDCSVIALQAPYW